MPGQLLDVNGTRLFVDVRGDDTAPPLLYIHGGPGQGCYDFMHAQGDRLARSLRIIGVDQRGVLRSDDLPPVPALSMDLLIADFEEIRTQLGIRDWAILGHSAGGACALKYASDHPGSVRAAIYDCPCWDGDLADRNRLPVVAERLTELGDLAGAARCMSLASKPTRITAADGSPEAMLALGEHYLEVFFYGAVGAAMFEQVMEDADLTKDQRQRGASHRPLIADLYDPKLHLLETVTQPSLLIHGLKDLVAPPAVLQRFTEVVDGGEVHTFQRSGHFAYHEEAEGYGRVVRRFVAERQH